MGYINRFVTSQAVLRAAREKNISNRRIQGYRGPVGAMKLDMADTIQAFLDYWDMLGEEGWIYSGIVEYPELPFGGVYCFIKMKEDEPKIKKSGMRLVETLDEEPIDQYEYKEEVNDFNDDGLIYDITNENTKDELLNADSAVVNDVMFRRQRVLEDKDPDKTSDVIDELEKSQKQVPQKEVAKEVVRHQLYKLYEDKFKGRKAVFNGKETKGFKNFLDIERCAFDPNYKEYNADTGKIAIIEEQETPEFKGWLKDKREKK